jgi:hypothetical protein
MSVMRDQHRGIWRRWLAKVLGGAAAVALTIAPSANAALPRYECPPSIADCTTVTGAWIDVPAHIIYDSTANDQLTCPSGEPVGYSYEGGIDGYTWVLVQVFRNTPNTSNPQNPDAAPRTVFFKIYNLGGATTVRDRIGCAPVNGQQTAPSGSERERTWTDRLDPSETRTYTHACSRGRQLVQSDATVEFLTQRRPSLAELTAVKWQDRDHGNRQTVRVTTSARLQRSARAVIKTSIFCDA